VGRREEEEGEDGGLATELDSVAVSSVSSSSVSDMKTAFGGEARKSKFFENADQPPSPST